MSSFNNVTKIKYTGNSDDLVTLNEYILFEDDRNKRKYVVFRFINNVTQQLLGMRFEVSQYDLDGNVIEKSVVIYNKFLAGAEEDFVPKAKLRVNYDCKSISVRLIEAAFDRFIWKEGEFEDNSYKFDHFYRDEKLIEENKKLLEKQKKPKKEKKEPKKQKKSKRPFILRDSTRRNFARFPVVFNVLAFVIVLAFTLATLLIFKNDSKQFTYMNYYLREISGSDDVAICGYEGSDTDLVIPATLGSYKVTKIDSNAFRNSRITSVTINADVTVDGNAFVDCSRLTKVTSDYLVNVMEKAFLRCEAVTEVTMPHAYFYEGAFAGSVNLKNASYSNKSDIPIERIVTVSVGGQSKK